MKTKLVPLIVTVYLLLGIHNTIVDASVSRVFKMMVSHYHYICCLEIMCVGENDYCVRTNIKGTKCRCHKKLRGFKNKVH